MPYSPMSPTRPGVEGAHRVSLQTEVGNTAAQALYASFGFEPVTGLTLLNRLL